MRKQAKSLTDIVLQISEKAMRSLKRVAERRELPIEAVMKFYIRKRLREDSTGLLAEDVFERTEQAAADHLKSSEVSEVIHEIKHEV